MNFLIYYGLTILALIITLGSQGFVTGSYKKYSKVINSKCMTGKDAARFVLDKNGLTNIDIVSVNGFLTDHYDPSKKVIRLSSSIYSTPSIGAVAVACHECGHAIQDKNGYFFMRLRSFFVPITNLASYAGYLAILIGVIFGLFNVIWFGILMEIVILVFQIITLPVEFDASKRALSNIKEYNILNENEHSKAKTMLIAAALTYVAGVASTLLEILRLILIFGRRDD